jgi:hypothetical protein
MATERVGVASVVAPDNGKSRIPLVGVTARRLLMLNMRDVELSDAVIFTIALKPQ